MTSTSRRTKWMQTSRRHLPATTASLLMEQKSGATSNCWVIPSKRSGNCLGWRVAERSSVTASSWCLQRSWMCGLRQLQIASGLLKAAANSSSLSSFPTTSREVVTCQKSSLNSHLMRRCIILYHPLFSSFHHHLLYSFKDLELFANDFMRPLLDSLKNRCFNVGLMNMIFLGRWWCPSNSNSGLGRTLMDTLAPMWRNLNREGWRR